ncbi:MAG: exosortase U [Pirellulaceae bacterium]|nr:exosortase U [Pirellulaceae bacterium]
MTSPLGGETAAWRAVQRAVGFAAVVILAHLPLFLLHLRNLWVMRPHYQFFPLLLGGIGWLLWKRWPRWSVHVPPSWWSSGLLGCGLAVLAVSVLFFSPWLAAVAIVLSVGGLIGRYAAPGQWRDWLPVWLVMWLIVPPPFRWDYRLILWLQSSTSRMASVLLDVLGVQHLMEGNALVLPGHRMLVDEACSGVNSVLVLLVLTALFVVAARRPLIWTGLLLASSVAWAWAANVVRVSTIAIAQAWFQLDLSSGWRHELLGYVTILLALSWLVSTDYCLAFFLRPIVLRDADLSRYASWPSPLSNAWNWCMGAGWTVREGGKRRAASGTQDGSTAPREVAASPVVSPVGASRDYLWLGAFGLLATVQLASFAVPASDRGRDFPSVRFERGDMPAELDGWSLVDYAPVERGRDDQNGHFSSEWRYRREPLECRVSVDYPFHGWHELTICYTGSGWGVVNRREVTDEQPRVETELSKPTGEYGWLLFALFGPTGECLEPSRGNDARWPSLQEKLARSPLGSWLLGRRYGGVVEATYQVQVFASSAVGLSAAQRADVQRLFLAAQARVVTAYLGKAAGRKP